MARNSLTTRAIKYAFARSRRSTVVCGVVLMGVIINAAVVVLVSTCSMLPSTPAYSVELSAAWIPLVTKRYDVYTSFGATRVIINEEHLIAGGPKQRRLPVWCQLGRVQRFSFKNSFYQPRVLAEDARGWPLRCTRASETQVGENATEVRGGLVLNKGSMRGPLLSPPVRVIPYDPLWFGLLSNILLYAALCWTCDFCLCAAKVILAKCRD